MKGGDYMIRFLKRLFRKDNNVLINALKEILGANQ